MMKGTPCSSRRRATLKTLRKTHYLARSSNPAKRVRAWAQSRPAGFYATLRHTPPTRKGLYISWQLRPDRLYKFREEKKVEQPRPGDEGIGRTAAKMTAETTLPPPIPPSLPLDRARRLARHVVNDAIDAFDLVDDARRGAAEEGHVERIEVGGHAVDRGHGA
jgi:hypothetical protein